MLLNQLARKRKRAEGKAGADVPTLEYSTSESIPEDKPQKNSKWKKAEVPEFLYGRMDGFLGLEELDGDDQDYNLPTPLVPPIVNHVSALSTSDYHDFDDEPEEVKRKAKKKKEKPVNGDSVPKPVLAKPKTIATEDTDLRSRAQFQALPIDEDISLPAWSELSLSDKVLSGLTKQNFTAPTPIQSLVMPAILEGRNVIGKASTGSGKTLAFGLPILEHLCTSRGTDKTTAALILAPTRELAQQISQHLVAVSSNVGASIVTLTGGLAVEKQLRLIRNIPDIIVATPGRLWDLMSTHEDFNKQIAKVKFVVLDEADRLLQKGHFQEITSIFEALEETARQTLVFSATFQGDLQHKLKQGKLHFDVATNEESLQTLLRNLKFHEPPLFFDANPDSQVVQAVHQSIIETAPMEKDYLLYYLLLRYPARTLVFANSISDVHRLTRMLSLLNINAFGLHSNKQQKARLKALERFKADDKSVLVASDVAARGLDIPLVDTVIHYHLSRSADLYIHRSGRTARAEAQGLSIILCSPEEKPLLKKLQVKLDIREFADFPIDANYIGQIKPRVNTTRQILKLEDTMHRDSGARDAWLAEAAEDLGADVEDDEKSFSLKQTKLQIAALRKTLAVSLKKSFAKNLSGRYLTRGGAGLASRLLSGHTNDHFIGEKVQKPSEHYTNKL